MPPSVSGDAPIFRASMTTLEDGSDITYDVLVNRTPDDDAYASVVGGVPELLDGVNTSPLVPAVGRAKCAITERDAEARDMRPHAEGANDECGLQSTLCSSSILSKRAGPPIAVGAMPVRVNSPKSFHRSTVTTVHSAGTSRATSVAAQPLVLAPL